MFIPTGGFQDTTFEGMIYDVDNNKYYEISGNDKDVSVTEVFGFDKSNYSQFIISTYLSDIISNGYMITI
ncbi:hypothetical protein AM493_07425 [Flavobacterium akiainvivens]|uniref:Uncharacterized protein n=1 Tax=Flavobacterium akiainvivens TaxID=1202724 RepID=A0A0M8MCF9_9FLAO|nr:hypothetical protein [Flavobacterium akiainvivens]KOS05884.1 hypothetical protein AM493_07425 [Flavobacterium akiainvivens]